jgi:hypothetical protein
MIKHMFIIEHFPIFLSFLHQIERFLCHWMHKLEGYKFFWFVRNFKNNIENIGKG